VPALGNIALLRCQPGHFQAKSGGGAGNDGGTAVELFDSKP